MNKKKLILLTLVFVIFVIVSIYLVIDNKRKIIYVEPYPNSTEEFVEKTQEQEEIKQIQGEGVSVLDDYNNSLNNNEDYDLNQSLFKKEESDIILFYGEGCPHCTIVKDFIKKNNIDKKVSFVEKEIYYNKENSDLLTEKAQICNLSIYSIGVPFLWDGETCFSGSKNIIDFFTSYNN